MLCMKENTEQKPEDFFNKLPDDLRQHIDICIKGTKSIRDALKISEDHYLMISPLGTSSPRDYYLYAAMDEVEKAGMALMTNAEMLSSDPVKEDDRISRNLYQQTIDGQMLWLRKMAEVLAELILFSTTNSEEYYKHYIYVRELVRVRAAISDSETTYGSAPKNYKEQEVRLSSQIVELEQKSVDIKKCWYLKSGKNGTEKQQLSSYAERFKNAFSIASEQQIVAMGISYHSGYGNFSDHIHFSIGRPHSRQELDKSVKRNLAGIGIIAANIIIQSSSLLGDTQVTGYATFLSKAFNSGSTHVPELGSRLVKPEIKVNDYAIANGDLVQIMEVIEGKHGFRSFKVKYLLPTDTVLAGSGDKKTVWTHQNPEYEHFRASMVGKLFDFDEELSKAKSLILADDSSADIDDEKMTVLLSKSVVEVWNAGLREEMHARIWKKPIENEELPDEAEVEAEPNLDSKKKSPKKPRA